MTNSLDKRTIRPFKTGRGNWLFSANPKGAKTSVAVYSIIETAKLNGLDPYKYLTIIFIVSTKLGSDQESRNTR